MSVPRIVRILNMSLTVLLQAAYYFSPLNNPSFIIFGPVQKPLYWFNSTSQLSGQYRLLQASLNAPGKKIRWNHKRFCSTRRVKRKTAQFLEEKKTEKKTQRNQPNETLWKGNAAQQLKHYLLAVGACHIIPSPDPRSDHAAGPFYLSVSQSANQRWDIQSLQR